jgi:hypothetical protein
MKRSKCKSTVNTVKANPAVEDEILLKITKSAGNTAVVCSDVTCDVLPLMWQDEKGRKGDGGVAVVWWDGL